MSSWTLTQGLQNLRTQINQAFPNRDKTSDGTIGDALHKAETSGHNPDDTPGSRPAWDGDSDNNPEVRAWDMDSDLRDPAITTQELVDHIRNLPHLDRVIRYIIFNRKMYHERNGFEPTEYTGSSPHTEHVHFEGAWSQSADNDNTFNYRLQEDIMLTSTDIEKLLDTEVPFPYDEKHPTRTLRDVWRYIPSKDVIDGQLKPHFDRIDAEFDMLNTKIAELTALLQSKLG